ncbi:hypothetical protein [Calothrix sp. 336/3]|uniref:hypothetical protein n=1 Tax=Calothrix sp. 336/3 TaxID=1337936 RepID=UPI0004E37300|nr:hypothetical protein [Calothrix sp. 336/3]AKG22499.1 hypothetical protein IJ00_15580 [Calothrix sp. 336/3]
MKASIKRIEATLHDLGNRPQTSEVTENSKSPVSFRISVGKTEQTEETKQTVPSEVEISTEETILSHHPSVQTFQVEDTEGKIPSLPKFKTPSLSSHRNGANPALAMNLLQEIQEVVAGWQTELQKIVRQVQDVYLEGPIVNGWLESYHLTKPEETDGKATLRHAEVDDLMNYVEEICTPKEKNSDSKHSGYKLCGLDASGTVWSRPCPPDQVASVSMAIARYQKLRQLLGRKQYLETRLSQLAETLVVLHSHIQS